MKKLHPITAILAALLSLAAFNTQAAATSEQTKSAFRDLFVRDEVVRAVHANTGNRPYKEIVLDSDRTYERLSNEKPSNEADQNTAEAYFKELMFQRWMVQQAQFVPFIPPYVRASAK